MQDEAWTAELGQGLPYWRVHRQALNPFATSSVSDGLWAAPRCWQKMATSLLFSLQQARAGTGLCRLDTSAFILDSALLVPLKPQVSSKQKSLWSVKGTTRITWDTRLRTCFNELFWCKASDVYFDQDECGFKCIILTNTVFNLALTTLQFKQSHAVLLRSTRKTWN